VQASILSVNIGRPTRAAWVGEDRATGIDKRPVAGPVRLEPLGVVGDHVLNRKAHGGVDQAVYAYASEDAAWWAETLGRTLDPGNFGENLTTAGIDLNKCVIGERWTVGTAVLEVSRPRIPCTVFAGFWDVPDLVRRFTERAHPGTYLRVLTPGSVQAGDRIEVVHRPDHGVTIDVVFRALTLEPALLPRLLDAPQLPTALRDLAARRVAASSRAAAAETGR
jgi:MOSC domain-containing protein YiiM